MTLTVTPSPALHQSSRPAPLHGRLNALRRRVAALLVRHLLPPGFRGVGAGQLPRAGIHRVLVCRPNHRLGNTVLMMPLLAELERHFPGAEVDVFGAGDAARDVYAGFGTLGRLWLLHAHALAHPLATLGTLRRLRRRSYDLVIDAASGSTSSRLAAALVRARFRLLVGEVEGPRPAHLAARPVHALRWALGADPSLPLPSPDLHLAPHERAEGRRALLQVLGADPAERPVLVVFPNATGSKRLPADWWRGFLDGLLQRIGPHHIVELVAADGVSRLDNAYPTYFTSDLRRLAAFIDAAGTYISADCGVMHLAAATSAITIGLFRSTDPRRYAPYGAGKVGLVCADDPQLTATEVAHYLETQRGPCRSAMAG